MLKADGWALFLQIFNILLLIGIIYFVFFLVVKLPRRVKANEQRLEEIVNLLREINKKIQN